MNTWPIYVISLPRSWERLRAIQRAFSRETFQVVRGLDGQIFENGAVDDKGRPQWDPEAMEQVIKLGWLHPEAMSFWDWVPCELACAVSHSWAWKKFLDTGEEIGIILEDDCQPAEGYKNNLQESILESMGGQWPSDADMIILMGPDGKFISRESNQEEPFVHINNRGHLISGWGNLGYAITRKGAERALEAQFPALLPCDQQWWMRAFKGIGMFHSMCPPIPGGGYAYAPRVGIIEHSEQAYKSTFTADGLKPWRRLG